MNVDTTKPIYKNIGESAKWPDNAETKAIKAQDERDAKAAKYNPNVHGDSTKAEVKAKANVEEVKTIN